MPFMYQEEHVASWKQFVI